MKKYKIAFVYSYKFKRPDIKSMMELMSPVERAKLTEEDLKQAEALSENVENENYLNIASIPMEMVKSKNQFGGEKHSSISEITTEIVKAKKNIFLHKKDFESPLFSIFNSICSTTESIKNQYTDIQLKDILLIQV